MLPRPKAQARRSEFVSGICRLPVIFLLPTFCVLLYPYISSDFASIAIVGDMMFGPELSQLMDIEGSLFPFSGVIQTLASADITYGFLEGSISIRGEPTEDKKVVFRSKPSSARGLANAGFDIVSLATSHIMDYGEEAFLDTLEFLSWYGVKYVGAGKDLEEARRPVIMTAGDTKVAFLAYCRGSQFDRVFFARKDKPGPAFPVYEELEKDISSAKAQSDLVIVSMHWGARSEEDEVTERQKLYAQKLIDSGADVVIGQKLNRLQGIEIYNGKPILYSLGDFIYGTYAKKVPVSFIIKLILSKGKLLRMEIIPVSTSDAKTGSYLPMTQKGQPAQSALMTLSKLSEELGTKIQIEGDVGIINLQ